MWRRLFLCPPSLNQIKRARKTQYCLLPSPTPCPCSSLKMSFSSRWRPRRNRSIFLSEVLGEQPFWDFFYFSPCQRLAVHLHFLLYPLSLPLTRMKQEPGGGRLLISQRNLTNPLCNSFKHWGLFILGWLTGPRLIRCTLFANSHPVY